MVLSESEGSDHKALSSMLPSKSCFVRDERERGSLVETRSERVGFTREQTGGERKAEDRAPPMDLLIYCISCRLQ